MRRETEFVLEQAAWPALVLEESGDIRRANQAASHLFGQEIRSASAKLAQFWCDANALSPEKFLTQAQTASVKLRLPNGAVGDFLGNAARVTRDGHRFLLVQFFQKAGGQFPEFASVQPVTKVTEPVAAIAQPIPAPQITPEPPAESFALEHAPWPALIVQQSGMIVHANRAATDTFGSSLEKGGVRFASLWLPENKVSASEFLEVTHETPRPIGLRLKSGLPAMFFAQSCSTRNDAELVIQLLRHGIETTTTHAPVPHTKPEPGHDSTARPPAPAAPHNPPASAESSVIYKQKLDCALQLTRSVALDFNNALTSILGHTSLLLSRMEPGNPWRESLIEIEKSATKAGEVAGDLAAFSRQEKDTRVQTAGNLNTIIERAVDSFRSENPTITWSLQFERRLCTANFDEPKIQQAFVKILENSIQATKGREARISIQTQNLELTEPTQDRNAKLNPGNYICAEISDNGEGILPDVLPRIFEPFFTTKGKNHRGLGLAWVYGIVTNHGGGVAVSSQPAVGTSVRIYLPANKKVVKETVISDDLSGTQTVLIVDDEDLLLTMGQMVLSTYGYTVLTANSGQKALEILSHTKKPIHLMITDLVMPNMSGRELTEQVQKVSPATRIIWSSGYVLNPSSAESETYLQKPFTSQDLLRKVKEALAD